MSDFIVAINAENNTVKASWSGTDYRSFQQPLIFQYRISSTSTKEAAEKRALRLHRHLDMTKAAYRE